MPIVACRHPSKAGERCYFVAFVVAINTGMSLLLLWLFVSFPPFVAAERNECHREGLPVNCLSAASFYGLLGVSEWREGTPMGIQSARQLAGHVFASFWMTLKGWRSPVARHRITLAVECYYPTDQR